MKRVSLALLVPGLVVASLAVDAQQPAPDIILTNGKIVTVDAQFSIAQAVAVRGDRIVAVGSNQDITRLAGQNTRRIDLRGRTSCRGSSTITRTSRRKARTGTSSCGSTASIRASVPSR